MRIHKDQNMKKINLLTLFFVSKAVCFSVGIAHVQAATDVDGTGFCQESHVTGTTVDQPYQAPETDQAEKGQSSTLTTDVSSLMKDQPVPHEAVKLNVLHVIYIGSTDLVRLALPTGKFYRFETHRGFAKVPKATKQKLTGDAAQEHSRKKRKRGKSNA